MTLYVIVILLPAGNVPMEIGPIVSPEKARAGYIGAKSGLPPSGFAETFAVVDRAGKSYFITEPGVPFETVFSIETGAKLIMV